MADDTDYSLLIPELPTWNDGKGIDVDSWLGCRGDFQLAIAFSRMFWPEFVEHDECVLYSGFSPDSYKGFFAACKGDRAAVERVMNHRHILDYFCHAAPTATAPQVIYLGRVVRNILAVKLAHDFPNRTFKVEFNENPIADLIEYEVAFWQPGNELVE